MDAVLSLVDSLRLEHLRQIPDQLALFRKDDLENLLGSQWIQEGLRRLHIVEHVRGVSGLLLLRIIFLHSSNAIVNDPLVFLLFGISWSERALVRPVPLFEIVAGPEANAVPPGGHRQLTLHFALWIILVDLTLIMAVSKAR